MGTPQSRDEFCTHLKEQLSFLRASSSSYDQGIFGEAKRLAATIRILVHDTQHSVSLLTSLGIKETLRYYDRYAGRNNSTPTVFFGVVMRSTEAGLRYVASLAEPKATSDFATWWSGIAIKQKDVVHTRKDIILSVADMDGGAHVDPALDAKYAKLSRDFASAWTVRVGDDIGTVENGPELPIVRQCACELELTLVRQVPSLLGITF
jgi:hypothetical protein